MVKTYQDLLEVGTSDSDRMQFVRDVISDHKQSDLYKEAVIAKQYYEKKNKTIVEYQKLLYTVSGKAVPDNYSANYKVRSSFFNLFVTQEVQYLLSNGASWNKPDTEKKLGKTFYTQLKKAGTQALWGGVSYAFFNLDHIDVFAVDEFAALQDETDGSVKAGVRFWQIDNTKPLRATFYELDGYTEYIWYLRDDGKEEGSIIQEKRPYIINVQKSEIGGVEIYNGENYPTFPIVPLWGNPEHQSELEGLREQIDCYDLIKSGFANTVDEASYVYWAIQGAGGMTDMDLTKFVERMKTVHAAVVEDAGATAESHTIEAPYASREALLTRLRTDLFESAMALDVKNIADGAVTATQIKAAYELLDQKASKFEDELIAWLQGILNLAGLDDDPTFTRARVVNASEEVSTVLSASEYLESSYVTEKVLTILGDGDKAKDMIAEMDANELEPLTRSKEGDLNGKENNPNGENGEQPNGQEPKAGRE